MGINSEWSDFYSGWDNYSDHDSDFDDEINTEFQFEDWIDNNSTELLNIWFTLQENAQLYYHLNTTVTFTDLCEFMYSDDEPPETTSENLTTSEKLAFDLWHSIGSPKTFRKFYIFYK